MSKNKKNYDILSSRKKIGKYKKSLSGYQCIGPCYEKNTLIIHPLTLEHIQQGPNPFCPITPFADKFGKIIQTDDCNEADQKIDVKQDIDMKTLSPIIFFDSGKFLKNYYHLDSLESTIVWIEEHPKSTYATIKRMMNCALEIYGKENLTNPFLINFLQKISKKYWFNSFVKNLGSQHKEEIQSTLNKEEIEKVLEEYLKENSEQWVEEKNHFVKIKMFLSKKLEKKLIPS